jgi:hypothetical protein
MGRNAFNDGAVFNPLAVRTLNPFSKRLLTRNPRLQSIIDDLDAREPKSPSPSTESGGLQSLINSAIAPKLIPPRSSHPKYYSMGKLLSPSFDLI